MAAALSERVSGRRVESSGQLRRGQPWRSQNVIWRSSSSSKAPVLLVHLDRFLLIQGGVEALPSPFPSVLPIAIAIAIAIAILVVVRMETALSCT